MLYPAGRRMLWLHPRWDRPAGYNPVELSRRGGHSFCLKRGLNWWARGVAWERALSNWIRETKLGAYWRQGASPRITSDPAGGQGGPEGGRVARAVEVEGVLPAHRGAV
jgi:hypothetical protein